MNFIYEPALLEYMQKKGKNTIVVEEIGHNPNHSYYDYK